MASDAPDETPDGTPDETPDDVPEPSVMRIEAALTRIEQQAARARDADRATPAAIAERLDRLIAKLRTSLRASLAEEDGGGRG